MLGLIGFGCSSKKISVVPEVTGKQYETSQMPPKSDETKKEKRRLLQNRTKAGNEQDGD